MQKSRTVAWSEFDPVKSTVDKHSVKIENLEKDVAPVASVLTKLTIIETQMKSLLWVVPLAGILAGVMSSVTHEAIDAIPEALPSKVIMEQQAHINAGKPR